MPDVASKSEPGDDLKGVGFGPRQVNRHVVDAGAGIRGVSGAAIGQRHLAQSPPVLGLAQRLVEQRGKKMQARLLRSRSSISEK